MAEEFTVEPAVITTDDIVTDDIVLVTNEEETLTRRKQETIVTDADRFQPIPHLLIHRGPRPLPSVQLYLNPPRCPSLIPATRRLENLPRDLQKSTNRGGWPTPTTRSPMAINTPNSLSEVHLAEWAEVAGADTGDGMAQGGMADAVGAGGALRVFLVRAWH